MNHYTYWVRIAAIWTCCIMIVVATVTYAITTAHMDSNAKDSENIKACAAAGHSWVARELRGSIFMECRKKATPVKDDE